MENSCTNQLTNRIAAAGEEYMAFNVETAQINIENNVHNDNKQEGANMTQNCSQSFGAKAMMNMTSRTFSVVSV